MGLHPSACIRRVHMHACVRVSVAFVYRCVSACLQAPCCTHPAHHSVNALTLRLVPTLGALMSTRMNGHTVERQRQIGENCCLDKHEVPSQVEQS
jgi:hypothetical protein